MASPRERRDQAYALGRRGGVIRATTGFGTSVNIRIQEPKTPYGLTVIETIRESAADNRSFGLEKPQVVELIKALVEAL